MKKRPKVQDRHEKVTPSCGCIFCDLGLVPDSEGIHRANGHEIACTKLLLKCAGRNDGSD